MAENRADTRRVLPKRHSCEPFEGGSHSHLDQELVEGLPITIRRYDRKISSYNFEANERFVLDSVQDYGKCHRSREYRSYRQRR